MQDESHLSPRSKTFSALVEFIRSRDFTAPFGVLASLDPVGKGGFVRRVTFGMARSLDCVISVWSPTKFTVESSGPLAWMIDDDYSDLDKLKEHLSKIAGPKEIIQ